MIPLKGPFWGLFFLLNELLKQKKLFICKFNSLNYFELKNNIGNYINVKYVRTGNY